MNLGLLNVLNAIVLTNVDNGITFFQIHIILNLLSGGLNPV